MYAWTASSKVISPLAILSFVTMRWTRHMRIWRLAMLVFSLSM
jgi:hypothetical protein